MGGSPSSARADEVAEPAPAKVNLDLWVTGRRPNGWHELDSLVVFTDWGDCVRCTPAPSLGLEVIGPHAAALADERDNLVLRSARLLAGHAGRDPAVRLVLEKRIPVAAGLGGGSADAAATLRALDRLWSVGASRDDLLPLAAELGADVPVCLIGRPTRMRGFGEVLAPLDQLPALALVLLNPSRMLSTAAVFAALGPIREAPPPSPVPADRDALLAWLGGRVNHLEAPARRLLPEIDRVLGTLAGQPGCRLARMTGSGATCFGLFDDSPAAERAASAIAAARPEWWVTSVMSRPR